MGMGIRWHSLVGSRPIAISSKETGKKLTATTPTKQKIEHLASTVKFGMVAAIQPVVKWVAQREEALALWNQA
jgi:hypothetical protein